MLDNTLTERTDIMKEEFRIGDIIDLLLPKWPLILISGLILAIIAYLYSSFFITPIYQASGTLYVTGDVKNSTEYVQKDTSLSDLMLSQELAKTYGQILSSNTFFKAVAEKNGRGYDYDYIQRITTITNVEETGILYVAVKHPNPQIAYEITNTILELAPDELARVVVSGSANIIDAADLPEQPISPNIPKNTLIGGFLGVFIAAAIIFLRDLFDNTLKTPDEIENSFGVPVLGLVPHIET